MTSQESWEDGRAGGALTEPQDSLSLSAIPHYFSATVRLSRYATQILCLIYLNPCCHLYRSIVCVLMRWPKSVTIIFESGHWLPICIVSRNLFQATSETILFKLTVFLMKPYSLTLQATCLWSAKRTIWNLIAFLSLSCLSSAAFSRVAGRE